MASFGLGEWLLALLIVAVVLGTRKLVSRTRPAFLYAREENRASRRSPE
jgi:Sec-independent protein translocase protein TatA